MLVLLFTQGSCSCFEHWCSILLLQWGSCTLMKMAIKLNQVCFSPQTCRWDHWCPLSLNLTVTHIKNQCTFFHVSKQASIKTPHVHRVTARLLFGWSSLSDESFNNNKRNHTVLPLEWNMGPEPADSIHQTERMCCCPGASGKPDPSGNVVAVPTVWFNEL